MTAFLEKLRRICATCPENVAGWSKDGLVFEVRSSEFEKLLKSFFKGTLKTFIRQLHFYGFSKSETVNGTWTFSHPKFTKFNPDKVLEITRKTRMGSISYAQKEEVTKLRREVSSLKQILTKEVQELKSQMALLLAEVAAKNPGSSTSSSSFCDSLSLDQRQGTGELFDFAEDIFNFEESSTKSLSLSDTDCAKRKMSPASTPSHSQETFRPKKIKTLDEEEKVPNFEELFEGLALPLPLRDPSPSGF